MRVVAVADTHTFQADLEVPAGDVFVHAGDMLRGGRLEELEAVAAWIVGLPHRHKVIVAGNHDWCFDRARDQALAMLPGVHYLCDSGLEIDGLRIWGSPWQPAYNDWAFNLPRGEALAERWSLIPSGLDLLITHGPPRGYGDRGPVAGRQGCADLRARVDEVKPRVHVFGHIHQDGGAWEGVDTLFANVTTWECERPPTVFEIDADSATAVVVPAARA